MMHSVAAVNALTVSRPSDGGQSINTKSKRAATGANACRKRVSRDSADTSSISAPARSIVAGNSDSVSSSVGTIAASAATSVQQHVVGIVPHLRFVDAEPGRRVALRVRVDDQHATCRMTAKCAHQG